MASYNELNALIDAYINRNGVQAITGQILNGVLKAMVEQLGRGYTIMGAATPATDPGTPDGPESWFASTPGTYTDMGGVINRILRKHSLSATSASIDTNTSITLQRQRLYKGYRIGFRANISGAFGRLRLGNTSGTYVARIEIDSTNIYYFNSYSNDASPVRTVAHGLTITDFVSVDITSDKIQEYCASVLISTRSGQFFDNAISGYWVLASGSISAGMVSGSLDNPQLTFVQLHKRIWWFGASFLDYLMKEFPTSQSYDFIMDGYPGCDSVNAYTSLMKGLEIGCPDILIWSIGMNDADSNSAINATWKQYYDDVEQICNDYGIEFIPVTTPTTPIRYNEFKNAVIRASGYRYVDVAQAVGADGTGAWTNGLLSNDNVHPTTAGSKVMVAEYLAVVPEMISS